MTILEALMHSVGAGIFAYGLSIILADGAEDLCNRFVAMFTRKKISLLTVSNAWRKP